MRGLLLIAVLTSVAHADVIDEDQHSCLQKSAGDSCEGGACEMTRCSRTRPDDSGKPVTTEWDCLRCVAGAPASGNHLGIAVGLGVAVALIAGGVVLARRLRSA